MKWYNSYQKQGAECKKTGNRFTIKYPWTDAIGCDQNVIVCVPFKTYCHSAACKEVRIQPDIEADVCSVCGGKDPKCPKSRATGS